MSEDKFDEERMAELDKRILRDLKKDVEHVIYDLTYLHPELFGTEAAVKELLEWTPSYVTKCFKESPHYDEGDENAPFFTEAFLYSLLGKGDARTLMRLLRDALGLKAIGSHL